MSAQIIRGFFQGRIINQGNQMRKPIVDDYETCLQTRIAASKARANRLQNDGDRVAAELEIIRYDSLEEALELYRAWGL